MANVILRLEVDPVTRKKNIWVKYDSDSDATPIEHEEAHRKIVEALLGSGALKPDELGTIKVEREGSTEGVAPSGPQGEAGREAVASKK